MNTTWTGKATPVALPGMELIELMAEIDDATEVGRYCATCGSPEGSGYAKHCCTDDNMLDD